MLKSVLRSVTAALVLLPLLASAEPVKLKLAFFSSDRTHLYRSTVKPFVDAVNAEGKGRVEIEVYLSGALGSDVTQQSKLLRDGTADIAYVITPYERAIFPDGSVIELPGLFENGRESTLAFTHLVSSKMIRGFDDYFVIGAFGSEPESIHFRLSVASLAEFAGKRIRANNETEIGVIKKLGATPTFVPLNETAEAISSGKLDGAYAPPVPMIEFGIGRVAPNHFMLRTSSVPVVLMMTRERFASLPQDVQALIAKYSGSWLVDNYVRINDSSTELVMEQLTSDPHRKVVAPSKTDILAADVIFKAVVDAYVKSDPHHAELVKAVRAETAQIRTGE